MTTPPIDRRTLARIPGDQQANYLRTGVRETGRFLFDDKLIDLFVAIANRPRFLTLLTVSTVVGSGLAYAAVEDVHWSDGIWWAVVTGFTVGYGDFFPTTGGGRVLGSFLIIMMFALALCLGAQITSRLIEDHDEFTHEEQEEIKVLLRQVIDLQQENLALIERLAAPQPADHPTGPGAPDPAAPEPDAEA